MIKNRKYLLLLMPYLIVSILPLVLFFAKGIELLISRKATEILQLMDSRIVVLLIKTVFYSLSVAFIVVVFATLIAIGLLSMHKTHRKFFMGLLILLIP